MSDLRSMTRVFVDLADTLVDDFDVIDLLHVLATRCVELLGVDAAGVMLADPNGQLRVAASSSEQARLLELFEVQADEGPCLDCYRTALPIVHGDLRDGTAPWPRFAARSVNAGFLSAHALPLRLRKQIIGALNLFRRDAFSLHDDDVRVAQAFADIATIAVLQQRLSRDQHVLADQLQAALDSRILIEQAKGVLAEREGCAMDTAFDMLRQAARRSSRRLSDVAGEVVASRGSGGLRS